MELEELAWRRRKELERLRRNRYMRNRRAREREALSIREVAQEPLSEQRMLPRDRTW